MDDAFSEKLPSLTLNHQPISPPMTTLTTQTPTRISSLPRLIVLLAIAWMALVCSAGCASGPSAQYKMDLNRQMEAHDFQGAQAFAELKKEVEYGPKNAVLYWLDQAALLHDLDRYEESELALDTAERRMDELFTRSRSKAAQRYFVNDATEDFKGEPYVRTLLHIYRAMNALYMRKSDDAAVEARKVTLFLQELADEPNLKTSYRDDAFAHLVSAMALDDSDDPENALISLKKARAAYEKQSVFTQTPVPQNAFQNLLLNGVEDEDALEEAIEASAAPQLIDWRNAKLVKIEESSSTEDDVAEMGVADAIGAMFATDSASASPSESTSVEATPAAESESAPATSSEGEGSEAVAVAEPEKEAEPAAKPLPEGELVFVHYVGKMPTLAERRIQIGGDRAGFYVQHHPEALHGQAWSDMHMAALRGETFVIALPEFVHRPSVIRTSSVWCKDGSCSAETELVSNLAAVAERTFLEQLDDITARAGARVAIKFAIRKVAQAIAYQAVQARGEDVATSFALSVGLIGQMASAATEKADTRSWLTAPAEIRLARIRLKPGTHDLRILLKDAQGNVISSFELPGVVIRPGRRTYQHVRTAY